MKVIGAQAVSHLRRYNEKDPKDFIKLQLIREICAQLEGELMSTDINLYEKNDGLSTIYTLKLFYEIENNLEPIRPNIVQVKDDLPKSV